MKPINLKRQLQANPLMSHFESPSPSDFGFESHPNRFSPKMKENSAKVAVPSSRCLQPCNGLCSLSAHHGRHGTLPCNVINRNGMKQHSIELAFLSPHDATSDKEL